MKEKRSSFTGGLGFVLAAAGSAVGLGNLWRFPYLAAQYGGGIFLLFYLILVVTFGFSLLIMEIAIGRKTKKSSILAYKQLHNKFGFLGYMAAIVPMIILPYYCVIGGWVMKYIGVFLIGNDTAAAQNTYYSDYISGNIWPLVLFLVFLAITALVVALGVEKGIERVSKVLMPVLLILTIGISIYVATLSGVGEGIKYYLLPDFSKFSIKTICAAMGQLFYSMSIAMGIMVSYGSYVKKDIDLNKSVNHIEIFDTAVALLSGFMIVPAVYVFSGEEGLKTGGAGLMFETLPKVFEKMPLGRAIGFVFFILVFLAALTSSISLMEAIASMVMDKFKLSRKLSVLLIFGISVILGIPSALGYGVFKDVKPLGMDFLTFFDYISNSVIMPLVAIFTCILIGWCVGTKSIEEEITRNGERFKRKQIFRIMVKYIAPVFLLVILIFYSLAQFEIISF